MSISNIMGGARVALTAYQSAISTTSKNISNVGNPDYVRRRADIGSLIDPNSGLAFREQDNTDRLESGFIQRQLWYKNQFLGQYESDEMINTQIETLFNEPTNAGLASTMNEFWNAWADLANDPESNTSKAIVKDKALLMTHTFNQLDTDLNTMAVEIGGDIEATARDINNLLQEIKDLNSNISGDYSYDLADSRDAAITKLSKLINIEVKEDLNHAITITTGGSVLVPLVNNDFINELEVSIPPFAEYYEVNVAFSEGGTDRAITGGRLGSLVNIQRDSIPDYLEQLNTLAVAITEEVNAVHAAGYNLSGTTGLDFFSTDNSSAGNMTVSDSIVSNPIQIATADQPNESGNGNIASAIGELQNGYNIRGIKFSDYYNSLISDVGSKVEQANFLRSSQEMVVSTIQNHRDSISGVSLDEEMSNLIKYEQAYQAASRMISVADELVQSVLNLL